MLLHIVLINFRDDVSDEHKREIYDELHGLVGKIDGVLNMTFGPNVSPEPFARGYTDGFTIDFRDAAARDAYLVHPDHQKAGARLVGAIDGGTERLFVFDVGAWAD